MSNHSKTIFLCLTIVEMIIAAILFYLFVLIKPLALRTISLFFVVAISVTCIFRWFNIFSSIPFPEGHTKRLASSCGVISSAFYYIFSSQSVALIAFAWLFVLIGFLGVVSGLQRIIVETNLLRKLLSSWQNATFLNFPVPLVYVHAEPGWGVHLAHRFVFRVMKTLWEHSYLSPNTGLTVYNLSQIKGISDPKKRRYFWKYRNRGIVYFIVSDSLRRQSIEFREWLLSQICAYIIIRTPLGENELYDETFENEVNHGYSTCLGPIFTILVRLPKRNHFSLNYKGDHIIECQWSIKNRFLESAIAPLSSRIASTAIPIAASDAKLDVSKRLTQKEISVIGLQPLANSYLRFRLAQSDVERYVSLIDCFESIIRFSVIILLIRSWCESKHLLMYKQFSHRLTLGSWVTLLESLLEKPPNSEVCQEICNFWSQKIIDSQQKLIAKVDMVGLYSLRLNDNNQINWLRWFIDLRNVTRGHGVLDESLISPIWPLLQESFLDIVSILRGFILSSQIISIGPKGDRIILQGWNRNQMEDKQNEALSGKELFCSLTLSSGQSEFIYPFAVVKDKNVLIFDHIESQEGLFAFIDYRTGKHEHLQLPESNLYTIWNSTRHTVSDLIGL